MGAEESKETASVDSSFMLVEEAALAEILFNPINSQAVCAGVGRHLNMRRKPQDIPTCDGDTKLMYSVLNDKLCIPSRNITVLNSSPDSQYPATICNIEDSLRTAVGKVEADGILLFYFSGHAVRYHGGSKVALVPADFVEDEKQLITADILARSLIGLKETSTQLVLIFDCCFAAQVLRDVSVIMGTLGFTVCAIAACAAVENSICFDMLGAGFFTYFMHDYMIQAQSFSCLPVKNISDYCVPLCNAMATLVLKRSGANDKQLVDASQHPTVITTELRLDNEDDKLVVTPVSDETDSAKSRQTPSYSNAFQFLAYQSPEDFYVDKAWSEMLSIWLKTKAASCLKVLQKHSYLKKKEVIETVLCLMMRSIAMLTAAHRPELALKPNIFVLSYFRVFELMQDVEPDFTQTPEDYMRVAILYYMKGIREYLDKTVSQMESLVGLYSALISDQKDLKAGQDETDNASTTMSVMQELEHTILQVPIGFDDLP